MGQQQNINLTEFLNPLYLYECLTTDKIQTLLEFTGEVKFTKNEVIASIGESGGLR